MTTTSFAEGKHPGEFLISEAPISQSREVVTIASGQNLDSGAVLGKVLRALAAAPNPSVVGTGNGTMTKVRPGTAVQTGNYVVKCKTAATNGGVFSVTAPDGTALPDLTLTVGAGAATDYTSDHIDFTITDGSTDFAVDDTFTIAVTAGGTPAVVGTGNGTMSAISMGPETQLGTYRAQCIATATNGGTFAVIAPNGDRLPDLVLTAGAGAATAYANKQINFTITDGSTDFASGDYFHIVVANGSKKAKAWAPTAVDGTEDPAGILYYAVDATSADTAGVSIARNAEVSEDDLVWAATVTAAQKNVAIERLKALGIVTR
jgi:hypothetical protein